jgi:hypothetical protein
LREQLDEVRAVRTWDTTRPMLGDGVGYVTAPLGKLRETVASAFPDDAAPRFVKEVYGLAPNQPGVVENLRGLLRFLTDHGVSGFICFGLLGEHFEFQVSWPSDSGSGIHWGSNSIHGPFVGWLNWCDPSRPLHQASGVGDVLSREYGACWGELGPLEPSVYPMILSEGHDRDALYAALISLSPVGPSPSLVRLDPDQRGLLVAAYPGRYQLCELLNESVRVREVCAEKTPLRYAPGYDHLTKICWAPA